MFTEIRFRDFRQQYPGFLPGILVVLVMLVSIDLLLVQRRGNYERQIEALRAGMTDNQRERGDALAEARGQQEKLKLELVRREAKFGKALHLSMEVDSSRMALMEEGAVLRAFPVRIGVERSLGRGDTVVSSVKKGPFMVERVLGATDAWAIPRWVYGDRRLSPPQDTMVVGALGPVAILLQGGAVIYSQPTVGPLKDTAYVLPGAVRANAEDLRAIIPNLTPGTPVYFY